MEVPLTYDQYDIDPTSYELLKTEWIERFILKVRF